MSKTTAVATQNQHSYDTMKRIICKKWIVTSFIIFLFLNIGIQGMDNTNPKGKKHTTLQSKELSNYWCQCKNTPSKNETITLKKNTNFLNESETNDLSIEFLMKENDNKNTVLHDDRYKEIKKLFLKDFNAEEKK